MSEGRVLTVRSQFRLAILLKVSTACDCIKSGSSKIRNNRLQKLIAEHMFFETTDQTGLRRTHPEMAEEVLPCGSRSLVQTLKAAIQFLAEARLLTSVP